MKLNVEEIITKTKKFLTNRDLLVFMFFLLISTALWTLQELRKQSEDTVELPLKYVNLPNDYVVTNDLPDHLKLTLEGQGTVLVKYRFGSKLSPLEIDLNEIAKGKKSINTNAYISQIQKKVSETQIKRIYPENIAVTLEKQKKKTVPVALDATIDLHQQYTLCDSIKILPARITAYGPQKELSEIDTIYTEHIDLEDLKDTTTIELALKQKKNVRYSDTIITIKVYTEKFTEKSIQVPISTKNVPSGYMLRIFPSTVTINYQVGLSNYDKIDATAFAVEVDYREAQKNGKDKLDIKIKKSPKKAFNIKLKPESVGYIIEEKHTNK